MGRGCSPASPPSFALGAGISWHAPHLSPEMETPSVRLQPLACHCFLLENKCWEKNRGKWQQPLSKESRETKGRECFSRTRHQGLVRYSRTPSPWKNSFSALLARGHSTGFCPSSGRLPDGLRDACSGQLCMDVLTTSHSGAVFNVMWPLRHTKRLYRR